MEIELGKERAASLLREAVADAGESIRELDHRRSDRIDVWLLWRPHDDLVFVEVADGKSGGRFAVEVRDGERPLDVFEHPYAYAAVRCIDTRSEPGG
jgi:hypothetical protein